MGVRDWAQALRHPLTSIPLGLSNVPPALDGLPSTVSPTERHREHHVEYLCPHMSVYIYDGIVLADVGLMLYCPACGPVGSDTPRPGFT